MLWPRCVWKSFLARPVCYLTVSVLLGLPACWAPDAEGPSHPDEYPIPAEAAVVQSSGFRGGILRYSLAGEPATFNFLAARDARSKLVTYLTTATLLEFDSRSQEVNPGLMQSYSVSEDGRSVRLTLRAGVRFSDGVPLSAEDILWTFHRIYDEESANVLKDSLLFAGQPVEVSSPGDNEVLIRFPEPHAAAAYILSTVPILPRHHFTGGPERIEEHWTLATQPSEMCGLGPFSISAHEPARRTRLQRNPHYWKIDSEGTRLPYLDGISLEYVQDRNTQLLKLKAGELDLSDQLLRPEDIAVIAEDRGGQIIAESVGPSTNLSLFWFNLNPLSANASPAEEARRSWFSETRFRQAVQLSINKQALVKNVFGGYATEAESLVPIAIRRWHSAPRSEASYDPARARDLLRSTGFLLRKEGPREILVDRAGRRVEFELLVRADDILGKTAAVIQQDLERVGMQVGIRQAEFRAVISSVTSSRQYDSVLLNLDFPLEPSDYLNVLASAGPMHMWHPSQAKPATVWEERIDQLMALQIKTLVLPERQRLFAEVQSILQSEVPVIPLVSRHLLVARSKRLKNVSPTITFPYALWNVGELYLEPQ